MIKLFLNSVYLLSSVDFKFWRAREALIGACHFKAAHVELHTQTGVTSYVSVRFARKVVQIAPFRLTILFCMRNIFGGDNPEAVKFGEVSR